MQGDPEATVADITARAGGTLRAEERQRALGPIPLPRAPFGNGHCPDCAGELFLCEFGDTFAVCGGCGAQVDPDELTPG
jgi:hypothetical protein